MALLADGWHMSSHAVAIGLSAFAYAAARRHASDPRFAFGTWKIEVLGGFASAIFLLVVVGLMVYGSVERLFAPAADPLPGGDARSRVLGLAVNIVSALHPRARRTTTISGHGHDHDDHGHHDGHPITTT